MRSKARLLAVGAEQDLRAVRFVAYDQVDPGII
jgi:hypothetical protein